MSATAGPGARGLSPVTWLVVLICWATVIFDGYDVVVYGAVVPSLLEYQEWGLTPVRVGILQSYTLIGMFIGSILVGTVTDVVGRRKMLTGCIVWFSLAMGLVSIAPTPELFGLFRFIAGLGLGGVLPVATALTTEYSPPRYRNIIYAFMFTGFPIGGILAAFLGIFLIPAFGFRIMFFLGLLPLVLIVPLAVIRLPESIAFLLANGRRSEAEAIASRYNISLESDQVRSAETAEESASAGRFSALSSLFSRNYVVATLLFWVTSFLGLFMIYGLNTWLPEIMRTAGYSLGSALSFLLVLNVGGIIGTLLIGVAADRIGSKPTTVFTFLLAASSVALLSIEFPLVGGVPAGRPGRYRGARHANVYQRLRLQTLPGQDGSHRAWLVVGYGEARLHSRPAGSGSTGRLWTRYAVVLLRHRAARSTRCGFYLLRTPVSHRSRESTAAGNRQSGPARVAFAENTRSKESENRSAKGVGWVSEKTELAFRYTEHMYCYM